MFDYKKQVQHNEGKHFKFTIDREHNLRIKIPKGAKEEEEIIWIEKCQIIQSMLESEDIQFTLRMKTSHPNNLTFNLMSQHGPKNKKFTISRYSIDLSDNTILKLDVPDELKYNKEI